MEKKTSRTIRLGIFVLTSVVLFTIAVYLIGQKKDMFSSTFLLKVKFNNVNGLRAGNNVRFSGINVGVVVSVNLQNDSTIEVVMRIQENQRPYIKQNAQATIGTDGLMGNMLININPGREASPIVHDNDYIQAFSAVKTNDIMRTLNVTSENAAMLTANLLQITQSIKNGKGTVSYLLYDTVMRKNLSQTMVNLQSASYRTSSLVGQLQQITEEIKKGKGLVGWATQDSTSVVQVKKSLEDLQIASKEIHETTSSLTTIVTKINSSKGALNTLLYDTAAARDIRQTLKNVNEGSARFSEDMEALKHNFLLKKYFKNKEKGKGQQNK